MKNLFLCCCFLFVFGVQAQIKHTVVQGESIYQIAKKYQVTPFDLYRLNPDAKNGIQEHTVLLIPKAGPNATGILHKVAPKETLYSIAKKYEVTVKELENWNPAVGVEGLKIDQYIYVSKPTVVLSAKNQVVEPLPVQMLVQETNTPPDFFHTVLAKETKYGIATKYKLSIAELEKLNPQCTMGLTEGMVLKVPAVVKRGSDTIFSARPKIDLLATADFTHPKELVILLPINLAKIESDTLKTRTDYLRTSKFLNLTLDFYAGCLKAIDSAKVLGLPVRVTIYDVESSKYASNVATIISENDFSSVAAVIGPFQNSHVESTAQLLAKYAIPVISPLSKEKGLALPNLYYAVPSESHLKATLFNYFKEKNGNVVAIVSPKKASVKEYLKGNYPSTKFGNFNEKEVIDFVHFKSQLVKGKPNFVILEIEKGSTILNLTKVLLDLQKEYEIQLVVFEVYDALNFDEIPIQNLANLKMMYPSVNKTATTPEELVFAKEFMLDNNVYPNAVAVKGFDVTFDTILRICQAEGFEATTALYATEHVGNNFDYATENGANHNKGCFLLYYETDLTIQQVK